LTTTLLVVQHIDHEGPDQLGRLAKQRGLRMRVIRPDRGELLPSPDQCASTIALVLGGPMGVNERNQEGMAWLERELDWLTAWHQACKPVIGICLGAQLLAVAAGGTVETLRVGAPAQPLKEVGFGAIHWRVSSTEEALVQGQPDSTMALHWHGDRIRLPQHATLLASSLHCAEQVFRIGQHGIGLQCHLEITGSSLERWITADHAYVVGALGYEGADQLRNDWTVLGRSLQRHGKQFFTTVLNQMESITDG
tara:strand:+ start:890 stop:1645 length:756 start_codon:yes stop_codon:yes gene_type:complete